MKETKIVVVGAGTTGSVVAYHLGRQGYKVLLLDRKKKAKIGQKVCGNGIGTDHLRHLRQDGLIGSIDSLVECFPSAVTIHSQNYAGTFPLKDRLAIIDRHALGKELLEAATEFAEVWDNCKVRNAKKTANNNLCLQTSKGTIIARYCIDAAGFRSPLQPHPYAAGEAYACYRAYLPKSSGHDSSMHFWFSISKTRGGYIWDFPQNEITRNVGLGIPKGKGVSPFKQFISLYQHSFKGQGGHVPTRHPFPSLFTEPCLLHLGDAGNTVNPWHGGGLSPGIEVARFVGTYGLLLDSLPVENIERINGFFWDTYGRRYAFLDLFRILLQQVPNDNVLGKLFRRLPLKTLFFTKEADLIHSALQAADFVDSTWLSILQRTARKMMSHLQDLPLECSPSYKWGSLDFWRTYEQIYADYETNLQQLTRAKSVSLKR